MGKLREKHEMTEHMFVCYNMGTAEERRNPVEETDICAGSSSEQYGITDRQADVAYAMVRYGKPASEIIAEYGVTEEEFTAWVRDGRFSEYASALARGFAQADAPYIWNSVRIASCVRRFASFARFSRFACFARFAQTLKPRILSKPRNPDRRNVDDRTSPKRSPRNAAAKMLRRDVFLSILTEIIASARISRAPTKNFAKNFPENGEKTRKKTKNAHLSRRRRQLGTLGPEKRKRTEKIRDFSKESKKRRNEFPRSGVF